MMENVGKIKTKRIISGTFGTLRKKEGNHTIINEMRIHKNGIML
jgi:hypothetical protein